MKTRDMAGTSGNLRTICGPRPDDLYFIRAGEFVKVGRAKKPIDRIDTLRTGCPFEFGDILIFFGRGHEERAIHRRLAPHRSRGEWFKWGEAIKAEIASLEQRAGIAPALRYV